MSLPHKFYQRVNWDPIETDNEVQRYILDHFTGDWLWTAGQVARWTNRSHGSARRALRALKKAGILKLWGKEGRI